MVQLETTHAPLLTVRCGGELQREGVERAVECHRALLDFATEHVLLVDLSGTDLGGVPSEVVSRLAGWLERRADGLADGCSAGAVLVDDGEEHRRIAEAPLLERLEVPVRVFREPHEAFDWLRPYMHQLLPDDEPSFPDQPTESSREGSLQEDSNPTVDVAERVMPRGRRQWSPYGPEE